MTFDVIDQQSGHCYALQMTSECMAINFARSVAEEDQRIVLVVTDDPFVPPVGTFYPKRQYLENPMSKSNISLKSAVAQLNTGAAVIHFEKKDGSVRRLYGTRNIDVVAAVKPLAVPTGEKDNPADLVTVFDLEAQGWRSFRHDQFISAEAAELPDIAGIST